MPLVIFGWVPPASAMPGGIPVDIVVMSSANPSTYDQSVTYTATLTTSDFGNLDPTDNIEFLDGGGNIQGCNFQALVSTGTAGTYTATCSESAQSMSIGSHGITAQFFGDSTYASGSGSLTQTVNPAATDTVITYPSPGATVPYGNENQNPLNVTVSAPGVSDFSPSGVVDFYDGVPGPNTHLCTAFLGGSGSGQSNGNCYLNNGQLNAGLYSLSAVYAGDSNFNGSSSVPQDFTVNQVATQMQLFPVPGYAIYGSENGNFFITGAGGGNGGNPTGFFTITTDGVNLVSPGTCSAGNGGGNPCFTDSATALPASTTPYEVTASYSGDANFAPASATVPLSVYPASSTTALTVSLSKAAFGNEGSVVISATVTAGTTGSPSGSVAVQSGGDTVCTISSLTASGSNNATGSCTLSDTQLPVGNFSLTGDYQGDGNYQSSISSARPLTITNQSNYGYWLVGADGGIFAFDSAQFHGSTGSLNLQRPIVGITPAPGNNGYWLVASDGGVFAFNAPFAGSIPGLGLHPADSGLPNSLNKPIVGIVPSASGQGYYMVASDGGLFAFNATFAGSCPGIGGCSGAVVGVAPDATGNGYWLVTATGHVYTFGDASYYGAPAPQSSPITSMVRTPSGGGYWILDANGHVFAYGNAATLGGPAGSTGGLNPATAIFSTSDGAGYWVVSANGSVFTFGDAPNDGSMAGTKLNGPIVAGTGF